MQILLPEVRLTAMKCVLVLAVITISACRDIKHSSYQNTEASVHLSGLPFNPDRAIFLNQYTTPSTRTTSWILVDSSFILHRSLSDYPDKPGKGKLCILHWSQANDPVWIGARIPGTFLGADLLQYENEELVIRQYKANGLVSTASESYRKEIALLLKQINPVRFP